MILFPQRKVGNRDFEEEEEEFWLANSFISNQCTLLERTTSKATRQKRKKISSMQRRLESVANFEKVWYIF